MPGFRFRYFFSEKLALRTTIGLNFDHDKFSRDYYDENEYGYYKRITSGNTTYKNRNTTFSIAPGLEYHFGNFERMSLYVGGELFLGFTTSKSTVEIFSDELYYTRPYYGGDYFLDYQLHTERTIEAKNCYYYSSGYYSEFRQNAPLSFGLNALMGMDFYIYRGLYMGAELGLGYTFDTFLKGYYKETIATWEDNVKLENETIDEKLDDKITSGNFSFRYNPMIRFGWRF
jgi:hypothetical protein